MCGVSCGEMSFLWCNIFVGVEVVVFVMLLFCVGFFFCSFFLVIDVDIGFLFEKIWSVLLMLFFGVL